MFVRCVPSGEISQQGRPVHCLLVDALPGSTRLVQSEVCIGYEPVELREVATIEGIDKTRHEVADQVSRASRRCRWRAVGLDPATSEKYQSQTARDEKRGAKAH